MIVDQLVLLKQLGEIRKKIHSLCAKTKCDRYTKCKKCSTVCSRDDMSPFRKVIRNNGGDFDTYLKIRKILMEYNYPLVISQACRMGGYSTDDLCQEGMLGLCEAIDRFDFAYGNQFSTYAHFYINKYLLEFMRSNQTVRLATRISYLSKISEEAFDRLVQKRTHSSNSITPDELLKEVKVIRKTRRMGRMKIRTSELVGHLSRLKTQLSTAQLQPLEQTVHSTQEHSDSFYDLLNDQLEEELSNTPIWLSEAIKIRFGLGSYTTPTPINEIAAALGITPQGLDYHIKQFFEKSI